MSKEKGVFKNKFKNASTFMNSKIVDDKGIINLRDNSYAKVFSVDAIDLSLTLNTQKNNFFHQLKYLYQLKDLDLRIYKLDDKIDLTANKDYYKKLMGRIAIGEWDAVLIAHSSFGLIPVSKEYSKKTFRKSN